MTYSFFIRLTSQRRHHQSPSGNDAADVGRRPLSNLVGRRSVDTIDADVGVAAGHRQAEKKQIG